MSCPKRLPLVAVDLVKCLTYGNTSALQFDMHKRQTINQYCNIITIIMFCAIVRANRILIDDLQPVVMDVLFIYECNILGRTESGLGHYLPVSSESFPRYAHWDWQRHF